MAQMSPLLKDVSIVIPAAPGETAQAGLLEDLENTQAEINILSEGTRASSLNAGARKAKRGILWFLHADSRITDANIEALAEALQKNPKALHYFDLEFEGRGVTALNATGANIRSHILGLPYGDQGFCIAREQFEKTAGYPEQVPYGEDLLFVRRAKKSGIKLNPVRSSLLTSAREYKRRGWFRLTLWRQWQLFTLMLQKP
jgi:GT2 family glycosyltransferase